ncbi:MAG: OadG family protein [Eubacteriales bacterium]|nr:OadG family protein [Eubacteriales bacterium]
MKPFFYVSDAASGTTEQVQTGAAETTGSTALKNQGENAPFAERAGYAGGVTLLGIATIFIVLSILWGVVELLHRALHRGDQKTAPAEAKAAPAPVPVPAPKAAPAPVRAPAAGDDALVAVITAAVAAAMAEEGYAGGFRVVSFRRTQNRRSGR